MPAARFRCLSPNSIITIRLLPLPSKTDACRISKQCPSHSEPPASDSGGTGVACEVLLSLSNLPLAEEGADRSLWPYLEVQVLLTEPDPGFRHRVEEALADKAVRLTSIIPSYPKMEGEEDSRPFSYTDLQKIAPLVASPYLYEPFRGRFAGRVGKDV